MSEREELAQGILEADLGKPTPLDVDGWPAGVYVRCLSIQEQMDLQRLREVEPAIPFTVRILVSSICDEQGTPLFTQDQIGQFMQQPFPRIMQAFAVASRVNGIVDKELEEAIAAFTPTQDEERASE